MNTECGLIEPFETDDLANSDAEFAFALGVEWAMFRKRLLDGSRFSTLVIDKNAGRIVRMVERHGRFVEHHHFYPGWVKIVVGDYLV
jgi:hypothetical protein